MNENTSSVQRQRHKFLQWLFPIRNLSMPENEPGYAEGHLTTHITCVFDWLDRLRILVSGKVEVKTYTKTDVMVNKAQSTSVAYILPPNYPIQKKVGG